MELRLENQHITRQGRILLKNLNLAVKPGDVVHVTGANGVGKSSLLRALAGLLPADLATNDATLISDHPPIKPDLSPVQHLNFWAVLANTKITPSSILKNWGLADLVHHPARILSAGQAQRLNLARLDITPHHIWLLDEPFTALDAAGQKLLTTRIKNHGQKNGMVIIASHQPVPIAKVKKINLDKHV